MRWVRGFGGVLIILLVLGLVGAFVLLPPSAPELHLGKAPADAPANGLLLGSQGRDVVVIRPDGSGRQVIARDLARTLQLPAQWSPDGQYVAYASSRGDEKRKAPEALKIVTRAGQLASVVEVPANGLNAWFGAGPLWSPNGEYVVFAGWRGDIYAAAVGGAPHRLGCCWRGGQVGDSGPLAAPPSWRSDSGAVAF